MGPIPILARVGAVAYRLQLPASLARLHPVFHISLLRPYHGDPPPARPPVFQCPDDEEYEVEKIAGHRTVRGRRQFLVFWKGYPSYEATWEPEDHLAGSPELLGKYLREHNLTERGP